MLTGNDANVARLLRRINDLVATVAECEQHGEIFRAEALRPELERLRWLLAGAVSHNPAYSARPAALIRKT